MNGRPNAPTFHVLDPSSISQDEVLDKVFDGTYWGAIVATAAATDRFEGALASDAAAQSYNASQALLYAGLEVRYATAWSGFVLPSLQQVIQTTNGIFRQQEVAPLLASETAYSGAAIDVMLNPVSSTYANLSRSSVAREDASSGTDHPSLYSALPSGYEGSPQHGRHGLPVPVPGALASLALRLRRVGLLNHILSHSSSSS